MEWLKQTPMGAALLELAEEMEKQDMPPVTLQVIGGFALMLRGVRPLTGVTDIDYVGPDLQESVQVLIEQVGRKHQMETGWINNDGMLLGGAVEDFELSTGKLHFDPAATIGRIQINVLAEKDLLRLKVIALDTALTELSAVGTFARTKDFSDVHALMKRQCMMPGNVCQVFNEYILCKEEMRGLLTDIFLLGPEQAGIRMDEKVQAEQEKRKSGQTGKRSPFLASLMKNLMQEEPDTHVTKSPSKVPRLLGDGINEDGLFL